MKFQRATEHHEIEFDLTAMIDVVFLLIIFFTFSTVFTKTMAAAVDLPNERGEASVGRAPATSIMVDIAKDGTMTIPGQGRATSERVVSEVRSIMARAAQTGKVVDLEITVRADRATPALHVNRLAADLATAGIRTWKLATSGEGPSSANADGTSGSGGAGGAP
ncbi:MAG: biopolymer transporter ExbD [Phycisphaerales bacterium]|nr:biopolymer transporter ExbD [Phycisphaerales bacterium]